MSIMRELVLWLIMFTLLLVAAFGCENSEPAPACTCGSLWQEKHKRSGVHLPNCPAESQTGENRG
jgi:hypothetical protein